MRASEASLRTQVTPTSPKVGEQGFGVSRSYRRYLLTRDNMSRRDSDACLRQRDTTLRRMLVTPTTPGADNRRKGAPYVRSEHNQVERHRPAGPAPLRGADLLVKPRRPARREHSARGLGSLRHYQPLRAGPRAWQHPRPDLLDLRRLRPGGLPRNKPRRTPGVGGDDPHGAGQCPVPAAPGGHYLLRARGGAGGAGGPGGVRGAAPHLREHRVRANRSGGRRARVRGSHPRGRGGLALRDAAEVGRSPLGRRQRVDVPEPRVRVDDRPREHPVYGAVGGCGASDKWGVDGLERTEPPLWCPGGGSNGGPAEGALTSA